jgi:cytochrome c556
MKSSVRLVILAAALGIAWVGAGTAWAQDAMETITKRQDTMKAQGKAFGAVKAYTEDKGDLAAAQAGGADLLKSVPTIPGLFPQKTGMAEYPGKSYAKPEIWAEWNKFNDAVKGAQAKAEALNVALKGGDKAAITAAFGAMGKDGCGGCHTPFREKKPG